MFTHIRDLLPDAAKKVHLGPQVKAGLVCSKARGLIVEYYPPFSGVWEVRKFETKASSHKAQATRGVLTITAKNPAAASNLQMRKQEILGLMAEDPELKQIKDIKIESF